MSKLFLNEPDFNFIASLNFEVEDIENDDGDDSSTGLGQAQGGGTDNIGGDEDMPPVFF